MPEESGSQVCPFCEGNESQTEREVFALRHPGTSADSCGWQIRVVPNKFPALTAAPAVMYARDRHREQLPAVGPHEVIVETPYHWQRLADLSVAEAARLLSVYRDRVQACAARPGVKSVALFRNEGRAAGASQEHPHSQVVGLPVVPGRLAAEISTAHQYLGAHGSCMTCDLVQRESHERSRLLFESDAFVAILSFAPRVPYETWLIPKSHDHDFRAITSGAVASLGAILLRVLQALRGTLGTFPYNLILHTAPVDGERRTASAFHWRIEIAPRITVPSGLELGSDVCIVSVPPEEACLRLREGAAEVAQLTAANSSRAEWLPA